MSNERVILHVDMDAFFASIEQRDNPDLRGRPVLVGGSGQRGVVAAASYEARKFGVFSAMPVRKALARCPDAVVVRSRMDVYQAVSRQVFSVFRSATPEVEGLSFDEAFLDVSRSLNLLGTAHDIARKIKADITEQTGLTASVGIAANKLVAKIASDLDKPDGLTFIPAGTEADRLATLDVRVLPGIGKRKFSELEAAGVLTIADLQTASDNVMSRLFGRYAARMRERSLGIDVRPVVAIRDEKSVSSETTFDKDLAAENDIRQALLGLSDRTGTRLRNKSLLAGVIQVKIRQSDFRTYTRQSRVRPATANTQLIFQEAAQLVDDWRSEHPGQRIRLLGVGGAALAEDQQLDMFSDQPKLDGNRVDKTVDAVRERFSELGSLALQSARTLRRDD